MDFRKNYLYSLGFSQKKLQLENVLYEESDVDKLRKITENYILPDESRTKVWKILLDVIPSNCNEPELLAQILVQRQNHFLELKNCMGILKQGILEQIPSQINWNVLPTVVQTMISIHLMQTFYFCPFPPPEHISNALPPKTATNHPTSTIDVQDNTTTTTSTGSSLISTEHLEDLIKIAQIFCLVFQNQEMDCWWCFYKFLELPKKEFGSMSLFYQRQFMILHKLLQIKEPNLTKHLLQAISNQLFFFDLLNFFLCETDSRKYIFCDTEMV